MKKLVALAAVCSLFTQFKAPATTTTTTTSSDNTEQKHLVAVPSRLLHPSEEKTEFVDIRSLKFSWTNPLFLRDMERGDYLFAAMAIAKRGFSPIRLDHEPDMILVDFLLTNGHFGKVLTEDAVTPAKEILARRAKIEQESLKYNQAIAQRKSNAS